MRPALARSVDTTVHVRRQDRRAAGISQAACPADRLGRPSRIHSASTIAAASLSAGHTGSATLATPINTTSHLASQR